MADPVLDPQALRLTRQRADIRPGAFAETVGISPNYLWQLETGRRSPSPELFFRMASALGIEPEALTPADAA